MNIFVAKLSSVTKAEDLQELFSKFWEVISAKVIMDRETGFSKRYGFVEMADAQAAEAAIATLNNQEFEGRRLRVNVAENKPRESRPRFNNDRGGYGNDRY